VSLEVFPNPTSKNINLSLKLDKNATINIQMYDQLGRKVATIVEQNINAGEASFQLSMERFPVGNYFIRTTIDNEVIAIDKVVKM
jgi:hypothetical protein